MTLAADDYPLADVLWTFVLFFALLIYCWLLITVFTDLFRRHDVSGWAKAGWSVFVIVLPLIGSFTYLITQGRAMNERQARRGPAGADRAVHPVRRRPLVPRPRRGGPRQEAARRGRDQRGGVPAAEAARPGLTRPRAEPRRPGNGGRP
jgi:hypothetical protein